MILRKIGDEAQDEKAEEFNTHLDFNSAYQGHNSQYPTISWIIHRRYYDIIVIKKQFSLKDDIRRTCLIKPSG
jgi:hypothetical protein